MQTSRATARIVGALFIVATAAAVVGDYLLREIVPRWLSAWGLFGRGFDAPVTAPEPAAPFATRNTESLGAGTTQTVGAVPSLEKG